MASQIHWTHILAGHREVTDAHSVLNPYITLYAHVSGPGWGTWNKRSPTEQRSKNTGIILHKFKWPNKTLKTPSPRYESRSDTSILSPGSQR